MPHRHRSPDTGAVRFYVDEDILGLGYGMMWLRHDVSTCGEAPFAEALPRGIKDPEWIPVVAELGLIAITNNRKIRTNPIEAGCAVSSGARVIGLAGKVANGTSWDKVALLTRHWRSIESFIDDNPRGPWWLSVTQSGTEPIPYRSER